jgi:hypothetical protein
MDGDPPELIVVVDPRTDLPPGARDAAELALAEELRAVRGLVVRRLAIEPERLEGAKASGAEWMGLALAMVGGGAVLPTAIKALSDWLLRQRPTTRIRVRKGDVEVEWSGQTPPPPEIQRMVERLSDH